MRKSRKKILAILPESVDGRLIMGSIIAGFKQNDCNVIVFDELYDNNLKQILKRKFDYICGYDYSGLKIKIDNDLKVPSINYFADDLRDEMSGLEWKKYITYLDKDDNYTFYWDKVLTDYESFKNITYLPHFVNFDVYQDKEIKPEYDVMFAGKLDTACKLGFFEELVNKLPHISIAWFALDRHYKDARERAIYPELIDLCYRGFIDNEQDMAKVINNSKIVFNIHSHGISSLNYRTFQTVACKRLHISDYREELALFEGHLPFYEDISDLIFKIENYLEDEQAYHKVTEECWKIAKQSHNSKDCARYMLKIIEGGSA